MKVNLGIDLGTSNVVVAYVENGKPVAASLEDDLLIPSYVMLEHPDQQAVVGSLAQNFWYQGNSHCYRRFKLDMGREISYAPGITPQLLTQRLAEEIKARLLGDESTISDIDEIGNVVVTVPHGWDQHDHPCRCATLEAVRKAGLNVSTLVGEPVAAAAYYTHVNKRGGKQTVLVCDMGGGTFDISLVEAVENSRIKVIDAEKVDSAGNVADAMIAQYILRTNPEAREQLVGQESWLQRRKPIAWEEVESLLEADTPGARNLLREAEMLKRRLNLEGTRKGGGLGAKISHWVRGMFKMDVGYEQMTEALAPFLEQCSTAIEKVLSRNSGLRPDLVVMAGGMGRMRCVQEMVAEMTGRPAEEIKNLGKDADRAVAFGAALLAEGMVQIQEVLRHSIGIVAMAPQAEQAGRSRENPKLKNYIISKRGTPIPFKERITTRQVGLPSFATVSTLQEKIMTEVMFGEELDPDLVEERFSAEWDVEPGVKGRRIDFWIFVDGNGIVQVGATGEGITEKTWEGQIPRAIRHYPRPVVDSADSQPGKGN